MVSCDGGSCPLSVAPEGVCRARVVFILPEPIYLMGSGSDYFEGLSNIIAVMCSAENLLYSLEFLAICPTIRCLAPTGAIDIYKNPASI